MSNNKHSIVSMPKSGGSKRPFVDFYQEWCPKVTRFLLMKCMNKAEAEDIASQAFLYAWQNYEKFDPKVASESTWIFMIAVSRWKNAMRDRRKEIGLDYLEGLLGEDDITFQAIQFTEIRKRVSDALESLPEETRKMVILRWFYGYSPQEIAAQMGMLPGAVRTRISRALEKMSVLLQDLVF